MDLKGFLADAASRKPGDEVAITVRDFLGHWGVRRRGASIVAQIRQDLAANELTTSPDFEYGWIDNTIRLTPQGERNSTPEDSAAKSDAAADPTAGTLKIGALSAATRQPVVVVDLSEDLAVAQALMLRHDFSQLPVTSGKRSIRGAVSWESIAIKRMHKPDATLSECVVEMHQVTLDQDLLPLIPDIINRGYIGVVAKDKTLSGIVTTADISEEFLDMAGPFLLIGECERHLRSIVEHNFTLQEITGARSEIDGARTVESATDLTFGELARMFEDQRSWARLGWEAERKVFVASLEEARKLRNEIMHFSTDPVLPSDLEGLRHLVRWLKVICASQVRETSNNGSEQLNLQSPA